MSGGAASSVTAHRTVITPEVDLRTLRVGPGAMVQTLYAHRQLIEQLARRQFDARFRGSLLGRYLALLNPLLLLGIYSLVFLVLLPIGGPGGSIDRVEFVLKLFGSLLIYQVFAETVGRAPTVVLSNQNFVKKVVFPLEVLPVADLIAAAALVLGNLAILLLALVVTGKLSWTVVAFPLLVPPLFGVTIGAAWLMASLGVYVRDLASSIGVLLTVLFYLTPVFYELSDLGRWQWLALLNPLAAVFESGKRVLVQGLWPDWATLAGSWLGSALIAWLGFVWFRVTKRGFADVL
jgi:lipopolysaccharide transport system permease protein